MATKTYSVRVVRHVDGARSNQPTCIVVAPSRAAAVRAFRAAGLNVTDAFLRDYGHETSNEVAVTVAAREPGAVFVATGPNGYGATVHDWIRHPKSPRPAPPEPRWVSCSAREYGHVGNTRHLVAPGALTTVCGASASHPDIWRADRRKPQCTECARHEKKKATR